MHPNPGQLDQFSHMSPTSPMSPISPLEQASPPVDSAFLPVPTLAESLRAARRARLHRVCTAIGLYIMLIAAGVGLGELLSKFHILAAIPLWFAAMALIILTILNLHDKQVL